MYFKSLIFDYTDIANEMGLQDIDYSGEQLPNSPKWSVSAAYSHIFSLPNGASLTPKLESRYRSSFVLNYQAWSINQVSGATAAPFFYLTDTSDIRVQEAYHIENFSMVYAHSDGKWTLSGYINNITKYAVKTSLMGGGMGGPSLSIGEPRVYGAVLSMKF